ncbi:uncharacterized protein LOC135706768 [Ochlerotatus camptorhynchus]|uniref:uncharacterized protein LOC135706768 n=1 Tax=Ochlerotatus camptorhynchus TaxID=644619 RepID=UPI0031D59140
MANIDIPGRNPLRYCRLCLTQVNVLKVLESAQTIRQPEKELLQKLFHYTRITFNNVEDYPSAVCHECMDRFSDFHEFRRMVVRNHNAVKAYRKMHGDEMDFPQTEEETVLIELIDGSQLTEIKQELDEYEDSKCDIPKVPEPKPAKETVKEVDVYHLDGELRNVVVKEEKLSSVRSLPVAVSSASKSKNEDTKKSPAELPHINVLNKKVAVVKRPQGTVLNSEHSEKRTKLATGHGFSIVKCSQCRAVFRSRENLIIHERNDHPVSSPTKTGSPKTPSTSPVGSSKPPPQTTQHVTLYKCTHCSSSFIHEANFEKHLQTCKVGILAKLNPQITVKRTAPAAMNETKAAVVKADDQAKIKHVLKKEETVEQIIRKHVVKKEETEDNRIRCHYCPLTYKTKHFLKKHMLDVHKIDDYEDVFYCHVCKLNYSCNEDLQLHNRAIHRFQCKQCLEDFRTCMHSQIYGKPNENGINKGTLG